MADCPATTVVDRDVCVDLPGGVSVCAQYPGTPGSSLDLIQQLMAQSSAAMAPLSPTFTTINTVLAVVEWAKSVPLLVVAPDEFAEKTQDLIDAAAALAGLAPPLSVPSMLVSMIDVLITMLDGIVVELQNIAAYQNRIDAAQAILDGLEGGNTAIAGAITCAGTQLDAQMSNLDEALSSANGFITLVNVFMQLIGLDPMGSLGSLGDDPTGSITALGITVSTLQTIRGTIPV